MKTRMDENLDLEQLLTRCKVIDSDSLIRIYFDPVSYLFHIGYVDEMDFFLPPTATLICECIADSARVNLELWIGRAVRKIITPVL